MNKPSAIEIDSSVDILECLHKSMSIMQLIHLFYEVKLTTTWLSHNTGLLNIGVRKVVIRVLFLCYSYYQYNFTIRC